MAKIVGKDPFTYEKERDSFIHGLKQFHSSRGTSFIRQPSIGGKEVDLFLLFNRVAAFGGYDKVNNPGLWEEIVEYFGIPKYCTNGGQAIKQFYQRFLYLYEKVSKGEDPDQRDEAEEPSAKRAKLKHFFTNVPTKYDHQQHIVADTVRRTLGMSREFARKEPYDKLEKALLSGLPNEVDFAINVCTLLSNEGRHNLNVPRSPRLIEILIAHVGIFRDGPGSLFTLHHEGWRPCTNRNFERFWIDSVPEKDVRDLLSPSSLFERGKDGAKANLLGESSEYEQLRNEALHVGRDLGVHDVEGQRILQVAMIIRNLSFEEENMGFLASNLQVFRFLMLCVHSKYWTLRQLGLDTLGNLALKMELDPLTYPTTQLVLGLVTKCISSPDRFDVVQGLEILARLCQVVKNWDLLSENFEQRVYDDIVNLLTVHDIQLIVFTLEALYHLTELGETPCNHIARINSAIDTLVQMVTIEAQAYGPNSLLGIKVVEHVPAGNITQPQPGNVHAHLAQRAGAPKPMHLQQRPSGTPHRPTGVPTPPRPHNISTPQSMRPGIGPTPPQRPGVLMRPGAQPHQPQIMNTALQRPGLSPYQRPGMSTPQQTMGPQGMLRPQLPANYMQRTPVNRSRNQAPTVNQAECDAIAIAWLNAYYECVPGSIAIKNEVYAEYLATCSRYAIKNALNSTGFSDCIKTAFPQIQHQRVERDDGTLEMQLLGIMRRPTPHAFPPPPKRVVTGYVPAPGGVRPMVYSSANSTVPPQTVLIPPTHRPVMATRQPTVNSSVPPQTANQGTVGTVVINAQVLPPVQNVQHVVATPPQTPPLATTQTVTQINQVASQNQTHQEVLTPNSTHEEAMERDQSVDGVNSKQENQYEACLPVNRPPSRRRSCSGSSAHGSPPRSPKRPTRTKSPKSPRSPRSKSPKSPRPLSPKGNLSRMSPRADIDINSDVSHAQMERIGEEVRVPLQETAIEKVENPCLRVMDEQPGHERPTNRQNGNVKLNGGSNGNKLCTNVEMVGARTTDESHMRNDAVHMNGDVLSPAPSDSSTAASDPMSPKRNGANPTTSPSILDKKAKIAQLLQDTKAAKEALGLGQNGIVTHLGNGDFTENKSAGQTGENDLPTAEGLTKQMAEATALMPETNGCDDNLLSESTDGVNDHLLGDDYSLAYSTDGTNDNLQGESESSSTNTMTTATTSNVTQTVIAAQSSQHQGTTSHTPTTTTLEQTEQSSAQSIVTGDQINTQVANTDTCNTTAQSSSGTGTTVSNQADKPGSVAIAELLQRKMLNNPQQQQGLTEMPLIRPAAPSSQSTTQQSHVMQQLQQRLQRPNPNTQQQVTQSVFQTSQQQLPQAGVDGSHFNTSTFTPSSSNVTTAHAAVQQQLLQRLRAPQLVQSQGQHQGLVQQRMQGSQAQQQLESPSRPSSTGPPSQPPSRPPSAGPQVRPPSTGPAPLPSPSGSSDAGTLPPASPPPGNVQPTRRPSTASTASTDSKSTDTVKAKKRKNKSNSIESRRSSNTSTSGEIKYMCQWNDCNTYFDTAKAVSGHVAKDHVRQLPLNGFCPWEKCDGVRRGKWSLMTHVQDRHLTEAALKAAAQRRQQQPPQPQQQQQQPKPQQAANPASSTSTPAKPGSKSAPVYPQDAALQAIRRFTPRPPYPELGEMKEGPVTKHIRLTSALILRNIAKYSSYGRSRLKRHESHLACMALSAVEASTALSHVLAELEHHALTSPAAKPESDIEDGVNSGEDSDMEDDAEKTDTIDTTDLDVSMTSQEGVVH